MKTKTLTMPEKYWKLLENFLYRHSEDLGNNGCNDWEFPSDWGKEEKSKFIEAFHKWNNTPRVDIEGTTNLMDFQALGALEQFIAERE